jgi:hypothetical protein
VRRFIAVVLIVAACGGDAPDLADTLGPIPLELDQAVSGLHRWLDNRRDSRANLYETLSGLGTTAAAGDLYDRVSRLDEPDLEADLGRYTRFVGDLLLASGEIDAAITGDQLQIIAYQWLRIEAGAGALAVGLEPDWCFKVTPGITADLCRPPGLLDYDAGVEHAVRLFLARYRPVMRLPEAFGDGVRSLMAVTLAPEVLASIDDALAELVVLNPPDALHRAVHDSFVDHLLALRTIWETVPETLPAIFPLAPDGFIIDITAVDEAVELQVIWPALLAELQTVTCDDAAVFAAARSPLRAALPASTIPALGALWFYGEGTGCL